MDYTKEEQATISAALNIIREKKSVAGEELKSPGRSSAMFYLHFAELDSKREHFAVAFLDSQHRLIETRTLFSGTLDGAAVYPREIARAALELNAAAVVLAHNHPSGSNEPSGADRKITSRIVSAVGLLDIRVLDHIILGDDYCSFAERGLI